MCVVGDNGLVAHDHNGPMNVYGYDPKVRSKYAFIVNVAVNSTEPETDQIVILLINQVIEMKGLKIINFSAPCSAA